MKRMNNRMALILGLFLLSGSPLCTWQADAATIQVRTNSINMFRDTRSANDVGIAPGDRFQFGANVVGGSLGTTLGAVYSPPVFTVSQAACQPVLTNDEFCTRSTPFDINRLEPWTLRFENGPDVLTVTGPSLAGAEQPFPFPTDVTVSGSGITPTISWTVPIVPDAFRVQIYDKRDHLQPDGTPDVIHSVRLPNTATSYTLPAIFETGLSLVEGGLYTIDLELIETRNHVPFVRNADILRRSSSFFAFSPLSGSGPLNVALPTIVNGVYHFNVSNVGPNFVTFIDPPVAIGYDYATGPGDPNFKSVLLPAAGDNAFALHLWNGSAYVFHATVQSGVEFAFPSGGVDRFRVLGIEPSAGLDPNNVTAFITGLTFVSIGQFTGTMTPIVLNTVNSLVTFVPITSTFRTTVNTSGCPSGFVGKFSFSGRFSDKNTSPSLSNLLAQVTTLTNGNLLQNADGGPGGVGATLTIPKTRNFVDGVLSPGEFIDIPFIICLKNTNRFNFLVDVLGIEDDN